MVGVGTERSSKMLYLTVFSGALHTSNIHSENVGLYEWFLEHSTLPLLLNKTAKQSKTKQNEMK